MDGSIHRHQAFIETVDAGSLTKAGQRLHCSQSSISRMIADLEREWGIALLRRSRSGIELTAEGELMLQASRELCQAYERMRERASEIGGLERGRLRIGTISSIATHRLPDIIAAFQRDFPGIGHELLLGDYSEIEEWIRSGRVDCGFLRDPLPTGIEGVPFATDELMAIMPEGHSLARLDAIPLEAFAAEPFLALEHGADTEIAEVFARAGLNPSTTLSTWDDYAIMAMVEKGLGLAILPSLILTRIPYRIVARPLRPRTHRHLLFAVRAGSKPSRAVERFREYLR